jgi:hypothetical protein
MPLFNSIDKRRVDFVKTIGNIDTVIGRKNIKSTTYQVKFQKALYPVDVTKPTYRTRKTFVYVINVEYGHRFFKESGKQFDADVYDLLYLKEVVKQAVSAFATKPMLENILMLIMGISLGIALGYILGNFLPFSGA